ncbi:DUF6084 family protein [Actinomadura sp. DC4]|uniref:DUF6084 family protein n=1 Tax=Actinomadura sp. DC4 TaxID=3055069 RepID=UPI0025B27C26|nr:DUF6084 family protein [Actinomadura sp. DC4]MDN3355741.1 DUF6084 family protein [Actinomadura sp. DC4]
MADLAFACLGVRSDPYAASPTLVFRLRITERGGLPVNAVALRCQLRIEPHRRTYSEAETPLLADLFGTVDRWGDTLKPLRFANVAAMVPGFTGATEIDLPVPCSYDLEVAASKYFASLEDGEIPLLLLFSGTVFVRTPTGFTVDQVPWSSETPQRVPVAVWREAMDRFFPGAGWLRLRRDTLAELQRYKAAKALPGWDDVLADLLARVGEVRP